MSRRVGTGLGLHELNGLHRYMVTSRAAGGGSDVAHATHVTHVTELTCVTNEVSPLDHLLAGGLEDPALALGQALDAVGGDLVQDRIDGFAEELIGGQVFLDARVALAPAGRCPVGGLDQRAERLAPGPVQARPVPMPIND